MTSKHATALRPALGTLAAATLAAACAGNGSTFSAEHAYRPHANVGKKDRSGQIVSGVALRGLEHNTEAYDYIQENGFLAVKDNPLSTFSIDVDTASYSNVRRFLTQGSLPPKDAVRVEELINYFGYDYATPTGNQPFSLNSEVNAAPWNANHRLVHIGLQGKRIERGKMPPRNLVFLVDVSGSMSSPNKLPLLKRSLKELTATLTREDRISMVVYAGSTGLVLPPTRGSERTKILEALDRLEAGGSTNGGDGILLAYQTARAAMTKRGINRVILASDGDFNIGVTNQGDLVRLIEEQRKSGVFLTVLGFGMGNYKDSTLEKLADKGNGNYAYIDTIGEARKVLVKEAGGTLVTIAKDVKIQVELNPAQVSAYRLIGYENRLLRSEDFNDDTKDAGEIGAGHSVTALYEIVPAGVAAPTAEVDALKYQSPGAPTAASASDELLTVKVRYKAPAAEQSRLLSFSVKDGGGSLDQASDNFRFSAAVAGFGMLLRDSTHKGSASWDSVSELAKGSVGRDVHGYRREFLGLVAAAQKLSPQPFVAR